MKILFTVSLWLIITGSAFGQYSSGIKRDANEMIKYIIVKNYKAAARYIMPRYVTAAGGIDKLAAIMAATMEPMIQDGAEFDCSIGEPSAVIKTKTGWYAVLPQTTIMTMRKKNAKGHEDTSLLALSKDNGKSWSFVDAGRLSDKQISQYFPDVYGKLVIKHKSEPVYTSLQ